MPDFPSIAKHQSRWAITIPGSATTTGAQLLALLQTAGYQGSSKNVKISGWLAGTPGVGGQRPAFQAATPRAGGSAAVALDFTTHGEYIPAGQDYTPPTANDADDTYVVSCTTSTIVALCIVYF